MIVVFAFTFGTAVESIVCRKERSGVIYRSSSATEEAFVVEKEQVDTQGNVIQLLLFVCSIMYLTG